MKHNQHIGQANAAWERLQLQRYYDRLDQADQDREHDRDMDWESRMEDEREHYDNPADDFIN